MQKIRKTINFEIIKLSENTSLWFFDSYNEEIINEKLNYEFDMGDSYGCIQYTKKNTTLEFSENEYLLKINTNDLNKPLLIKNEFVDILEDFLKELNWFYGKGEN